MEEELNRSDKGEKRGKNEEEREKFGKSGEMREKRWKHKSEKKGICAFPSSFFLNI